MAQQQGQQPQPGVASCYRHPGRETGISCARCERPICPSCMIPAPVGHQCPECVHGSTAAQAARATRPRTVAGAALTADTGLVTRIIIGLNLAVFLIALAAGDRFVFELDLIGSYTDPSGTARGVAEGEWYRMLTSTFLHEQVWHIGLNMLALWFLGPPLEAALGRTRYVTLYLVAGLAGSTLAFVVMPANQPSLGASGALYGLFGATAILMRRLNRDMRPIVVLLAINLALSFTWDQISWEAHIGGLIAGSALAYAMVHAPRERRTLVQGLACAALLLIIIVACAARTAAVT